LTWPNKDKFLLVPKDDNGRPVWVDWSHPAAREVRVLHHTGSHGQVRAESERAADNLIIQGDSLDALRALNNIPEYRGEYRGKVKLVYIDPPFNTGQTFAQYDDWMDYSTWLSFMHERLLEIRDLLAVDGSVWVHLDDKMASHCRILMDEVFGAQNFIATVVWQKSDSPRNSARHLSVDQDYVLIYARDANVWRPNRLPRTDEANSIYTNPDGDPRGPWIAGDPFANKPYSKGLYDMQGPTGRTFAPPPGRFWRVSQERLLELDADCRIWWGPTKNARPSIKRYLNEVGDLVPRTMWAHAEVGSNRTSKNEIRKLFPGNASFDTPKPEKFMERVLRIATVQGDVMVDVFGGSGASAAVAQKLGRRWVTAEINPETVRDFIEPRLKRVTNGEDPGGITRAVDWVGGGGFRTFEIGPSMYEVLPGDLVVLADWATNGRFAEAVAAQLGFDFEPDAKPFSGRRGRMRLAVFDGAVGVEEVSDLLGHLGERENVTIVAKVILDGAQNALKTASKGSRIRKAPRDLLVDGTRRSLRRTTGREPGPAAAVVPEETP